MEPEKTEQKVKEPEVEGDEPANQAEAKLTKNQLKKLREKRKKDAEKAAQIDQQGPQEVKAGEPIKQEVEQKIDKKGGKKPNAAALMAMKALQKQRQEEQELKKQLKQFEEKRKKEEEEEKQRERLKEIERVIKREDKKKRKQEEKRTGLTGKNKKREQMMREEARKRLKENQDATSSDSDDQQLKKEATGEVAKPNDTIPTNGEGVENPASSEPLKDIKQKQPQHKHAPKKKYVKKREPTIEQIWAQAQREKEERQRKQREEKERKEQQLAKSSLAPVESWQHHQKAPEPPKQEIKQQIKLPEQKEEQQVVTPAEPPKKKKREKTVVPHPEMEIKKEQPELQILKDYKLAFTADRQGEFRSPICCILGHVDTGKTTLLDKIRNTNVQEGEAGGITQQIGATFFPRTKLVEEVDKCRGFMPVNVDVPGLLIIDTPGHESFANLRSRGSSLCDIAILVIDLMHGLEQQTIESIELLRARGTPFVVALNKIDRSFDWKVQKDRSSFLALKAQDSTTLDDYKNRLSQVITQMNQKGFNVCMYWQNQDPLDYVSLVPTSGVTGEGLPDLLALLVKYSLQLKSIQKRIRISKTKFSCTVMEVKMIEGFGTTIDCILVDGKIRKDDQIVLLGFRGPIVTKVRALLTPHPMKEMRIKDEYLHHDQILAANGVKISAAGLDEAVAGTPLIVANTEEEIEEAMEICEAEYENIKKKIQLSPMGVGVAASTLGSLEALLEYLQKSKVPVSNVSVGPVSRDDVIKAMKSLLFENPEKRKKEYCCLLAFDVKVLPEAQKYAEDNDIRIFTADIIYHLTDHFTKYVKEVREDRKLKEGKEAVFPCILKQVATFRKCDPIVLGVDVDQGVLRIGTPICVYSKDVNYILMQSDRMKIGVVESIEANHKKIKEARKASGSVAIQLGGDPKISSGKDFTPTDKLVSIISRKSIDVLKELYRDEVSKEEWAIIIELKPFFKIG